MSLATPKPARPVPSTGPASQRTRIRPSALRVLEQAERERESERQIELPPVEELAAIFEDDEDMATIRRDLPLMQPRRLEVEVDDADATLKRPVRTQFTSEVNGAFVGLAIPTVDDEHAVEWDRSEVEPTVRRPLSEMAGELGVGPASDPQPLLLVRRSNRPPPASARQVNGALAMAKRNDRRRLLQGIVLFALVFVAVTLLTAVIVRLVSH